MRIASQAPASARLADRVVGPVHAEVDSRQRDRDDQYQQRHREQPAPEPPRLVAKHQVDEEAVDRGAGHGVAGRKARIVEQRLRLGRARPRDERLEDVGERHGADQRERQAEALPAAAGGPQGDAEAEDQRPREGDAGERADQRVEMGQRRGIERDDGVVEAAVGRDHLAVGEHAAQQVDEPGDAAGEAERAQGHPQPGAPLVVGMPLGECRQCGSAAAQARQPATRPQRPSRRLPHQSEAAVRHQPGQREHPGDREDQRGLAEQHPDDVPGHWRSLQAAAASAYRAPASAGGGAHADLRPPGRPRGAGRPAMTELSEAPQEQRRAVPAPGALRSGPGRARPGPGLAQAHLDVPDLRPPHPAPPP